MNVLGRQNRQFWGVVGVAAAVILAMQVWKAAREDYNGDEGFSVRRVEASWRQLYYPFADRVVGYAEPFDVRHVHDMNPPLYFALIRVTMGAHPGRGGMRVMSVLSVLGGLIFLAMVVRGWGQDEEKLKAKTDNAKVKIEKNDMQRDENGGGEGEGVDEGVRVRLRLRVREEEREREEEGVRDEEWVREEEGVRVRLRLRVREEEREREGEGVRVRDEGRNRTVNVESVTPGVWVMAGVWVLTPVVMFYGHEARPYALPLGMFCATLWLLWRWGRRPLAAGLIMFASALLGFLTNFHYPWMLGALGAALIAQSVMRDRWLEPRATGAALGGMALGIGAACLALLPQWEIWDYVRRNPTLTINWDVLGRAAAFPLIGPMAAAGPWHLAAALAVMAATLVLAVAMLARARRPVWGVTALCLWLIPFLVPVMGHVAAKAAFFERYTLFSLPGWALTLAWMVEEGMARRGWRQDAALLVLAAVVCNGVLMLEERFIWPLRPRWAPAVEALLEQSREDECYIVSPEWHIIAFAANAGRSPRARYLRPGEAVPAEVGTIWLLCDYLTEPIHENFLRRGWGIKDVVLYQGKELWRLDRSGGAAGSIP